MYIFWEISSHRWLSFEIRTHTPTHPYTHMTVHSNTHTPTDTDTHTYAKTHTNIYTPFLLKLGNRRKRTGGKLLWYHNFQKIYKYGRKECHGLVGGPLPSYLGGSRPKCRPRYRPFRLRILRNFRESLENKPSYYFTFNSDFTAYTIIPLCITRSHIRRC
jgi:hypothetical protein